MASVCSGGKRASKRGGPAAVAREVSFLCSVFEFINIYIYTYIYIHITHTYIYLHVCMCVCRERERSI